MDLKELYKRLTEDKDFKEWHKKNPKAYLVHFLKIEDENKGDWQIGYYDKKKDRITTFLIGEQLGIVPEQEVFKKGKTIKKLNITKIKISEKEIFKIVNKIKEKNYKKELPLKKIIVVQNLNVGQVWNITFLTKNFNTLNFKISTETGKVLSYKLTPLIDFTKK